MSAGSAHTGPPCHLGGNKPVCAGAVPLAVRRLTMQGCQVPRCPLRAAELQFYTSAAAVVMLVPAWVFLVSLGVGAAWRLAADDH